MQVPPLRYRSDGSGRDDKIEGNRGFRGARGFGMGQRQERPRICTNSWDEGEGQGQVARADDFAGSSQALKSDSRQGTFGPFTDGN